jgi:hypothetical protein
MLENQPQDIIERMCKLQEEVQVHHNHVNAGDCFCGKGGMWGYKGFDMSHWRNDLVSIEFIEQAVREKIKEEAGDE